MVSWDVTQSARVGGYQCWKETCQLHIRGRMEAEGGEDRTRPGFQVNQLE